MVRQEASSFNYDVLNTTICACERKQSQMDKFSSHVKKGSCGRYLHLQEIPISIFGFLNIHCARLMSTFGHVNISRLLVFLGAIRVIQIIN